ncbi:MAG: hypothetical protein Q7S14_00160 [bacterium]|nr:hypothetical protein [bacterium]
MNDLEKRIAVLEERNQRVEKDKAWETSWTRKIVIAILTYLTITIYFFTINVDKPLLNAIVPTLGFMLSTLTLPYFKKIWEKFKN